MVVQYSIIRYSRTLRTQLLQPVAPDLHDLMVRV